MQKGTIQTEETRRKISLKRIGKKHSEETNSKISKGIKSSYTPENRKLRSDVLKEAWKKCKEQK